MAIEHIAARPEIAWRATAEMHGPLTCYGGPPEALAILREQADARGAGPQDLEHLFRKDLQNGIGRFRERLHEGSKRVVFGLTIGRSARPLLQLRGDEDGLEGSDALARSLQRVSRGLAGVGERGNPILDLTAVEGVFGSLAEPRPQLIHLPLERQDTGFPVDRGCVETGQLRDAHLQVGVRLAQQRFGLLAVRDVARDLGRADDRSGLVADRRYGERDLDAATVFPDPSGLEVLDALAPAQCREDSLLLLQTLGRDDERDGLADRLFGRVAEDPLRAGIPGADDAVERLADDGVVRVVDDGGHVRHRLSDLTVAREPHLESHCLALQV